MGVMIHAEATPLHHTRTVAVLVNEVKALDSVFDQAFID